MLCWTPPSHDGRARIVTLPSVTDPRADEPAGVDDSPPSRIERLAAIASLGLFPLVGLMGMVQLTKQLDGAPGLYPAFLWVAGAVCALGLAVVPWLPATRRVPPALWRAAGAFLVLVLYAALTVPFHTATITVPDTTYVDYLVPRRWVAIPLIQAVLAMVAGIVIALATPASWVHRQLFALGILIIAISVRGQYVAFTDARPSSRLDTPIGGAAVYHVVLVLVLAVFVGLAWERRRTALNALLAVVVVGLIVATGSRAGLITTTLLLVALAVRWVAARNRNATSTGSRTVPRWAVPVTLAGLVAAVGVGASMVGGEALRLLAYGDTLRLTNAETAVRIFTSSPTNVLLGAGQGMVWPWFASEGGHVPVAEQGLVQTPYGMVITNPHSVYIGTLAELGLAGFLLLVVLLGTVVWAAWRASAENPVRLTVLTALGCTLVSFAFDYYLLKNFSLSLLWWFFLATALRLGPARPATAEPSIGLERREEARP